MHHRHLIYRLIHDLRRFGWAVLAASGLLFAFAILVFWPVDALLGHRAGSSLVTATIVWLVYGWVKSRHPGLSLRPRLSRRHALTLLGAGYALTALLAAVLFIIYGTP